MAFRRRDISMADDPIRTRQAIQAIATEARVANASMPALELQAEDPIRARQALQAIRAAAKDAAIQASADQDDEPVSVIGLSDARGTMQRFAKDFENEII